MVYLPLTQNLLPSVLAFVKKKEYFCTGLMEKLLVYKKNLKSETDFFFILYDNLKSIVGVVCFGINGRILHLIPSLNPQKIEEVRLCTQKLLENFYGKKTSYSLFCIIGMADTSLFLANCAEKMGIAHRSNDCDYSLMTYLPSAHLSVHIPNNMVVHKCGIKDAFFLADLQRLYYEEEVLPPGMHFNGVAGRKLLRQNLHEKLVFALCDKKAALEKRVQVIAKVSTNATGLHWCQIGGVYTLKKYRNCGCATFLVSYIANQLKILGYKSVLFVKKQNQAAIKAYQKAGFKQKSEFKIIYFK